MRELPLLIIFISSKSFLTLIEHHVHRLVFGSSVLSGALIAGFVIYWVLFHFILRKSVSTTNHVTLRRFRKPAFWMLVVLAAMAAVPTFGISSSAEDLTEHVLHIFFITCLAWFLISGVYAVQDLLLRRYDISLSDNLRARQVRTQMAVMRRLAIGFVGLLALGLILYTFNHTRLWQAGAGLLASAGLASLALAAAAKTTVSNLLAGIQIALTEPIRIDDVVIVDGQWGRIEEITAAYVVVCIWNLERLIVPLSYFIENPFQNWTRSSANLIGTCYIYADYSCPLAPLREEYLRVLKSTDLWDGKAQVLQVTDLFQQTMQIRALMSSADSGKLFDLRCYVREKMIAFIQQNYPQCLPKQRINELQNAPWEQVSEQFQSTH
ncbi:MAG TPA: mechanosensitive ion channel domain-containing protein [Acidobacteriaceae bacterium]|nr:mechanosensitive ion channel domain-containing protein [Acidobacteriaceae bacterium]